MNGSKAKSLRRAAMLSSLEGEPLRQLVQFAQICNPWFNPTTKKSEPRRTVCAVNSPLSFRGRYRNLKSGRTIDTKRIVVEQTMTRGKQPVTHRTVTAATDLNRPVVKPTLFQREVMRFNRVFRKQH